MKDLWCVFRIGNEGFFLRLLHKVSRSGGALDLKFDFHSSQVCLCIATILTLETKVQNL